MQSVDKPQTWNDFLQVEIDKQSAVIRDLNDKLKRASAAPRLAQDASKLKLLIESNLELERQVEELRGSLAKQQQKQPPVAPSAAAGGSSSGDKDEALLKKVSHSPHRYPVIFILSAPSDETVLQTWPLISHAVNDNGLLL